LQDLRIYPLSSSPHRRERNPSLNDPWPENKVRIGPGTAASDFRFLCQLLRPSRTFIQCMQQSKVQDSDAIHYFTLVRHTSACAAKATAQRWHTLCQCCATCATGSFASAYQSDLPGAPSFLTLTWFMTFAQANSQGAMQIRRQIVGTAIIHCGRFADAARFSEQLRRAQSDGRSPMVLALQDGSKVNSDGSTSLGQSSNLPPSHLPAQPHGGLSRGPFPQWYIHEADQKLQAMLQLLHMIAHHSCCLFLASQDALRCLRAVWPDAADRCMLFVIRHVSLMHVVCVQACNVLKKLVSSAALDVLTHVQNLAHAVQSDVDSAKDGTNIQSLPFTRIQLSAQAQTLTGIMQCITDLVVRSARDDDALQAAAGQVEHLAKVDLCLQTMLPQHVKTNRGRIGVARSGAAVHAPAHVQQPSIAVGRTQRRSAQGAEEQPALKRVRNG
jgi:hypothetical protein